jgi:hypothetical protein
LIYGLMERGDGKNDDEGGCNDENKLEINMRMK